MTGKRETIVILTPGFPASEADTNCLPLQQALVRTMAGQNPELQFIVISFQYPFEKKTYKWNGITVIAAGGKNKRGLQRRWTWKKIIGQLTSIRQTEQIKAIISFWCDETALIGSRFARKRQLRHLCWICGQDAKASNKRVKEINPAPEELVALSDFIQDEFERNHGIRPAHIILPGVDTSQTVTHVHDRPIDLLAAGSLIPLKQFDIFTALIAALLPQFPGLKAAICGEGPERTNLEKQIHQLHIQHSVILTGEVPHAELLHLMQRTKIVVHPSSYEGFGMVQAEALHAGAMVVSFVQPIKKEIAGWHIVPDKEKMCEKIRELLQAPPQTQTYWQRDIADTAREFIQLL